MPPVLLTGLQPRDAPAERETCRDRQPEAAALAPEERPKESGDGPVPGNGMSRMQTGRMRRRRQTKLRPDGLRQDGLRRKAQVQKGYGLLRLAGRLATMASRPRRRATLAQRLADFPRRHLPLQAPVRIHWSDRQIPFIEAAHDRDLAVALGAVHGHLRLAQMEIMRRLAYGRLSEAVGAVGFEIDHTLRIMDFPAAVPETMARMGAEARLWCEGFVDGVNAAVAQAPRRAEEFALFGIQPEPWRVEDVLAVGRLAAVDFSWRVWHRLFTLRDRPDWTDLWQRIMEAEAAPAPVPQIAGGGRDDGADLLDWLWSGLGRTGSNAAAVSARRSASGGALLASDPHLGIMLPSNWLAVAMRSPGYHIAGLMIPGLPVVTLGRNRRIGWSGTSLHAASSDLFDVSDLPPEAFEVRREAVQVRWSGRREALVRRTAHGPVISDSPLLQARGGRVLALTWIGHRPTDELSAMLAMMRADGWEAFTAAIEGFGAPAQNLVYADADGRVGQAMAAHLPERPHGIPPDLVMQPEGLGHWDRIVTARHLPKRIDPPEGYVASANNRPMEETPVPVGFFFSPDERIARLRELLGGDGTVSLEALRRMHLDTAMPSALPMRDLLLAAHGPAGAAAPPGHAAVLQALRDWDGRHEAESAGALAFELVLCHFLHRLHGDEDAAIYRAIQQPWTLLRADMALLPQARTRAAARAAVQAAAPAFAQYRSWGAIHRIRVAHPLSALPVIGRRFVFGEFAAGGSNETLMKTAHGFSAGPHRVGFGANARFLADMGDEDETYLVLLGGQDGWLGSTTFADQVDLWRRGEYCRVPLRPETARREFRHETVLQPAGTGTGGRR